MGEVDGARLLGQLLHLAARVVVALLEGGERVRSRAAQAQLGAQLCPVDLQGCAAL